MPSDQNILGHSTNRWYPEAISSAQQFRLPSGLTILVAPPSLFLATKLEAFHGRGEGDYAHHDMEDIVNLIDGRPSLGEEVDGSGDALRTYLREQFESLIEDEAFLDSLPMHFRPDPADQARVPIVIGRLRQLAGL
jgi:hypothetical protein